MRSPDPVTGGDVADWGRAEEEKVPNAPDNPGLAETGVKPALALPMDDTGAGAAEAV